MVKVVKISEIAPYFIVCDLNNCIKNRLEILPLIEAQKQFDGLESLENKEIFASASIGEMGETYWKDIISIRNKHWNYDISPEYIFQNGETIV